MKLPILSLAIQYEEDAVAARQRGRQISRLLGFDAQDQTRISTAVSEIARNALKYGGGGTVEYAIESADTLQSLKIRVVDAGPGIPDLQGVLDGRYISATGMGISGTRRLMDQFEIESIPGKGTKVSLGKLLPKKRGFVQPTDIARIADALAREKPQGAFQELRYQNVELLQALDEISARQADLTRLNRELEDTNRGVVALYAELDEKADHLRRADELKSRFLSNMSHEFRSPLNSILALTGLLRDRTDGELSAEQEQQVGYIRRSAQDLLELVNDLLDIAKVESGKVEARPVEFEAANLFAALRGMLRPLSLNPSVDLIFEEPVNVPIIYSDEGKISQILRNFISNALKFTEHGDVRVSVASAGPEVMFSVSDTGIGIAAEHQGAIFEEFVQLDNPIQRRVMGTGLGLPLSKKLATILGGTVGLESTPGVGSRFILRIPRVLGKPEGAGSRPNRYEKRSQGPSDAEAGSANEHKDSSSEPVQGGVLIIDDTEIDRYILRRQLGKLCGQIREATGGGDGIAQARNEKPRVIFLDLAMPDLSGFEVLEILKSDCDLADIPVVITTSRILTDKERAKLMERAVAIIRKDSLAHTDMEDLLRKVTGDTLVAAAGKRSRERL